MKQVSSPAISFQYDPQAWDKPSKMRRIKQRTARMQSIHHIDCKWSEFELYIYLSIYLSIYLYIYMYIIGNISWYGTVVENNVLSKTNFNHQHVSRSRIPTETETANPRRPAHFGLCFANMEICTAKTVQYHSYVYDLRYIMSMYYPAKYRNMLKY